MEKRTFAEPPGEHAGKKEKGESERDSARLASKDLFDSLIARLIGFLSTVGAIAAYNIYQPAARETNLGIPIPYTLHCDGARGDL